LPAKIQNNPDNKAKGNKKRVVALITALGMFIVLSYFVSLILGACKEPFELACAEPYKDMLMTCPGISIGEYSTTEEWNRLASGAVLEKAEEIKKVPGVTGVILFRRGTARFKSIMGETNIPCFLMDNVSDIKAFMDHKNISLTSGKLPEKPGEIVVDEKIWKNQGNAAIKEMSDQYHIVGHTEGDQYSVFGMALEAENDINLLVFHPDDGVDYAQKIRDSGVDLYYACDYKNQYESINSDVGNLDSIQRLIQIVTGALLAICLIVVLALHIMDRHQEWCLMNSIGFSSMEIYLMALRELLICFGIAIIAGSIISVAGGYLFEKIICNPIGVSVNIWRINVIPIALTVLAGIYGLCQIPLFFNIRKICTIDAIE